MTVGLNAALVPRMGYMGCAWAALACYFTMMVSSYLVGRAKHPLRYPVGRILSYFLIAAVLYGAGMAIDIRPGVARHAAAYSIASDLHIHSPAPRVSSVARPAAAPVENQPLITTVHERRLSIQ